MPAHAIGYPLSEGHQGGECIERYCHECGFCSYPAGFAGADIPADIQGQSLRTILENGGKTPADWRKAAYYHYYEYPAEHSVKRHYGIRTADFKLIHFYNDVDEWEMYDLKNDPSELNSVFGKPEYADKQAELISLLKRFKTV